MSEGVWADIRRGNELMRAGRFAEGLPLLDRWRELPERRASIAPQLPFAPWRGEDVAGKRFLIWSEEGYGDQIMYARFARVLVERGAEVLWLCPASLSRLLSECLGVRALPNDQSHEFSGVDFYCPSSRLLGAFSPTLATLPAAPYLSPPSPVTSPGVRLGVMVKGNPKHLNDACRSLDPASAQRLLDLPGATSLDPAETGARDFYDTARVIAGLDLVISVDTAVAHLAGAMGKPVWILVPSNGTDWRWMKDRCDSPWYPSARLYRQIGSEWATMVERVVTDAGELVR